VVIDSTIPSFNNGTSAGEIRLREQTSSGSNYVALKSPATLANNLELTFPDNSGTSGYVLQTNGAGGLAWTQNGGSISTAFIIDTTMTQVTGTVTETLLKSILIPANTFSSNSAFRVQFRVYKPNGGTFAGSYRVYLNTSAAIGGTLVNGPVTQNASGSAVAFSIFRSFIVVNQASSTIITGNSLTFDPDIQAGSYSNINVNWGNNLYLIISCVNNTVGGISQCLSVQIIPQ
jgi:hypothetical protein